MDLMPATFGPHHCRRGRKLLLDVLTTPPKFFAFGAVLLRAIDISSKIPSLP
jgi:hypothetical protein